MARIARLVVTGACVAGVLGAAGSAMGNAGAADVIVRRNGYAGAANLITAGQAGAAIPVVVPAGRARLATLAFLDQYGAHFGITDPIAQLEAVGVETDALGISHITYRQVHNGVPVFSGTIKVHQNAAGGVVAANGRFYPVKATLAVTPTLNADAAVLAAAKAMWHAPKAALEQQHLTIVDPAWYGQPSTGPRLAWQIVLNDGAAVRESLFIDAHTGEVLDQWTLIEALLDRRAHDAAGGGTLPGPLARSEGDPIAADVDVNKVYDYAGDFYRYLERGFGRDSIDGNGLTLVQTANSTASSCPNAFWNGFQAAYCTGVAEDDIVAHELAHGLTGYTAGLIYRNQSGQLNESFSDVFGELVDMFNGNVAIAGPPGGAPWPIAPDASAGPGIDTPNNARSVCSPRPGHPDGVRWLIGEGSSAFGGAIRDMWDPTCRNHPDRANSALQTCSATDSGGVHSGSGVPNHAFALLTDGGSFNGRTIIGIGPIKSGAVWYRALTTYLTPASDFKDAYDALNQAAADLIGTTPNDPRTGGPSASMFSAFDAAQVDEALLAVEMHTDGRCGQTNNVLDDQELPQECMNPVVVFSDDFEGSTLAWTVANSGPITPYDWVLRDSGLPFGRAGKAAYCEDRAIGDCGAQDESGAHWMTSPPFIVPATAARPFLAFTHLMGSEGSFDGGRVEISIAGGPFTPVPRSAIEFNPYNTRMRPASAGNTSPLAGEAVWSGVGGQWGRTIVDLGGLGVTGNQVQIRFMFSKDGCTGGPGWYVDDVVVYDCPDCDANGVIDLRQFRYRVSTPFVGPVGTGANPETTLQGVPAAGGNVTLELLVNADLSAADEHIEVSLNGTVLGRLFELGGADCSTTADRQRLNVDAAAWNAALALGAGGNTAVLRLTGSAAMNPNLCNGSYVGIHVRYNVPGTGDGNGNLIIDTCETVCPTIDSDPAATTVDAGQTAVFIVSVSGTAPFTYQWRRDTTPLADGPSAGGGNITGAASDTLTITGAGVGDIGMFDVVVTNACGSATSASAALEVSVPCPADINGVNGLTVQDIFDFLAAYFAMDPQGDFNGVNGHTVQDIFDFLGAYFAGCP